MSNSKDLFSGRPDLVSHNIASKLAHGNDIADNERAIVYNMSLTCQITNLYQATLESSSNLYCIKILYLFHKLFDQFNVGEPDDSRDALVSILNRIHDELKVCDKSIVSDLFMYTLDSMHACKPCIKHRNHREVNMVLSLDTFDGKKTSIEQLLFEYFANSDIRVGCCDKQDATGTKSMMTLPPCLIIRVNKLKNGNPYPTMVDYPLCDLDMTNYCSCSQKYPKYMLTGVVDHTGGHYYAKCIMDDNKVWYLFDGDRKVEVIKPNDVVGKYANILVYCR